MYNIAVCVSTLIPLLQVKATPNINISWTIVCIAVLPCLVTGIITYLIHLSNKRSEERKQLNSLSLDAAIVQWKEDMSLMLKVEGKVLVAPLESHIIRMLKLSEVLQKGTLTKDNIVKKLKEVDEINEIATEYIKTRPVNKVPLKDK